MSVLIKGMEIPKCCDVCQFSDWSNLHQTAMCKIYDYEPCFEDFSREYTSKRSNNCPLLELPKKHGRLIEEPEAFYYSGLSYIFPLNRREIAEYFANQVKAQPTVIEAEDET